MPRPASDVAFTPSVKAIQTRMGSRAAYARMEAGHGWSTEITDDVAAFIAAQTSVFLATATADGQPYIQHRGGPPGFLEVVDPHTLRFVDLPGNRQYISTGNLADNPKVHLFLIDYVHRRRVKIWGEARVVPDPGGRDQRVFEIRVTAWDANCPKHIPQRFEAADVEAALAERDRRIAALEAEAARLRATA